MIKFLQDYVTKAVPADTFTKGQELGELSVDSELHFVRRGIAAFLRDGDLFDHEGQKVSAVEEVEVVNVDDNRDDAGRDGRLADGTPQRASSGPGKVMTTAAPKSAPKPKPAAKK